MPALLLQSESSVIETETEGLTLRLDLNAIDGERAARLRARLLEAVEALSARISKPAPRDVPAAD